MLWRFLAFFFEFWYFSSFFVYFSSFLSISQSFLHSFSFNFNQKKVLLALPNVISAVSNYTKVFSLNLSRSENSLKKPSKDVSVYRRVNFDFSAPSKTFSVECEKHEKEVFWGGLWKVVKHVRPISAVNENSTLPLIAHFNVNKESFYEYSDP